MIRAAWEGIDPARMWDCHVHLVGTGDSGSGIWLNPALDSLWHPLLNVVQKHNPLLFDFVLKRSLRKGSQGLAARIFETRPFFSRQEK